MWLIVKTISSLHTTRSPVPPPSLFQAILATVGLKEALLDPKFTRMDPISPPDEESPFTDLLAWQGPDSIHLRKCHKKCPENYHEKHFEKHRIYYKEKPFSRGPFLKAQLNLEVDLIFTDLKWSDNISA